MNKLNEIKEAINKSVIAEKHWSNPNGKKMNYTYGITIYYPNDFNSKYDQLKSSRDTQWNENLK